MKQENLEHTIEQLSVDERKLLMFKAKEVLKNKTVLTNPDAQKRIVAYIKTEVLLNKEELKSHLKQRLPDYMIPSSINVIDVIPLLPNGKVDKKKLQKLKNTEDSLETFESDIIEPKNEIESTLVEIWEEVLGFSPISTNDNFFEIGGDSILSIQIVAQARKKGIHLKANQLFENQTILELSMFTTAVNKDANAVENKIEIAGEIPLTPVQHWYFETHRNAPHFWNQIIDLQQINTTSSKIFEDISKQLISNHEALRLSFNKKDEGKWQAFIKPSNEINSYLEFNLGSEDSVSSQNNKIEEIVLEIQENTNLSEGSLFKLIFFNCNSLQSNRVVIIAHHLVIDLVSWNIIVQEIANTINTINNDFILETNHNKTATIKDWANYLDKFSSSNSLLEELNYWNSQKNDNKNFPTDYTSNSHIYLENSIFTQHVTLDTEQTKLLVHNANETYSTKVEDLLIAALIATLCDWGNLEYLLLGLERQARNIDTQDIDVSNTVGWFTSFFPIALNYNKTQGLGTHIKGIKEELRTIPSNGIGFGVLKYLSNTNTSKLKELQPKVIFNYFGKANTNEKNNEVGFKFMESSTRDMQSERNYEIEINTQIINDNLYVNWSFTKDLYKEETALILTEKFIENLKLIIKYCITQDNITYTPSDFPEANINQDDLDNLLGQF
ncbi:condensation domain-containing protein [Algibacter luteus]|uniref:Non-ribosomal peptide synthase domain TIGR01720 n=1 Tax=Algibacter luteus TaxID=1178825 RepID=A0A1M6BTH0_9FLAO|nr:condensation domain-containing protein [Algibacter luteus]SHI51997.1 non-ribosomal peptide synthase domain TIGR01720 [Algibacter luteus]